MLYSNGRFHVAVTEVAGQFTADSPEFHAETGNYLLGDTQYRAFGAVQAEVAGQGCVPRLLAAFGFHAGVHENSALLLDDRLILTVGPYLCALSLPALHLEWSLQVDPGCCFGVYDSKLHHALITHGEQEISRVNLQGNLEWSSSGKDIFTGSFALHDTWIEAADFNGEQYSIEIAGGRSRIISPSTGTESS